ncbi:MAG TPA: alpha-N-acetylglucosaminidase [Stackebrandtia sp.]|jgi:alpha-N-acetylglucosaminidase|uniref:alpha-N-acetylglucosaminidase n=1 Tax=Stackebrandtia sp. TaxID=2023065 RepID=UPI002D46CC9C|nr:alpha-N-acetylglucosaminidase [Stackebrandtia sp.]HZE37656.1 alpha-N-acetylglucosaminidase [Stackebrandtia sp.]
MKRRSLVAGVVGAAFAPVVAADAATPSGSTADADAGDHGPARDALRRLLPDHHHQIELSVVSDVDRFVVSGSRGAVRVEAGSPATQLTGVNWYLKHVAGVDVSWPGDSLSRLPRRLPGVDGRIDKTALVPHRVALNDTHEGYTGPYRGWSERERELDLLALHGYTEVLVTIGADAVYQATFGEFGYDADELREWIPLPAHQPWWLLENMSAFPSAISQSLLDARVRLARKVLRRMSRLGMRPIVPGFYGTVPPGFADRNPGAHVVPQGEWLGFDRPDWLDPTGPHFAEVAAAFYRHQKKLLGTADMFKMDLMHEGGDPGDVPVGKAASAVFDAMHAAHPAATWVMLGWRDNPRREILDAIDTSRVLVVDGLSDRHDDLDREQDWGSAPYAFGTIPNFGGKTTVGANAGVWAKRFREWRTKPGSALTGIAWMPEAGGRDPAAFELFAELAWHDRIHLGRWFSDYADRRYGGTDDHARAGWDLLRRSAYGMPSDGSSEPADGLFAARPGLDVTTAAHWSPKQIRYDAETFAAALPELLDVDAALRDDAYRYDLVDIARQTLANASRGLLPRIETAYDAGDADAFATLTDTWMSWLDLLERLLASDRRFLLGPWLARARHAASTIGEGDDLEYDARTIITAWGHRAQSDEGNLHDYANRELSGLVSGLYARRWRTYFDALAKTLGTGRRPDIDWFAIDEAWATRRDAFPVEPRGHPHRLAREVHRTLAEAVSAWAGGR